MGVWVDLRWMREFTQPVPVHTCMMNDKGSQEANARKAGWSRKRTREKFRCNTTGKKAWLELQSLQARSDRCGHTAIPWLDDIQLGQHSATLPTYRTCGVIPSGMGARKRMARPIAMACSAGMTLMPCDRFATVESEL